MGKKRGAGSSRKAKRKQQRLQKRAQRNAHNRQRQATSRGRAVGTGQTPASSSSESVAEMVGSSSTPTMKRHRGLEGRSDGRGNGASMRARSDYGGDSSDDSQIGEEGDDYGMYPEDAEIAYLERKLFSGKKYRG